MVSPILGLSTELPPNTYNIQSTLAYSKNCIALDYSVLRIRFCITIAPVRATGSAQVQVIIEVLLPPEFVAQRRYDMDA